MALSEKEKLHKKEYYQKNKDMMKAKAMEYYTKHKDDIKIKKAEYCKTHKDEKKLYNTRYYNEHKDDEVYKEQKKLSGKQYREKNKDNEEFKERERISQKKYYDKNREKQKLKNKKYRENHKEYFAKWYEDHKDEMKILQKEWYEENKTEQRIKHKIYNNEHKEEEKLRKYTIRLDVLMHYSNGTFKCKHCGEDHLEFLEVDHIHGGGKKHKREMGIGSMYYWLYMNNYPDGYQILCSNCNWRKRRINLKGLTGTEQQRKQHERSVKFQREVFSHYMTDGKIKCSCPNCEVDDINVLTIDHKNNDGAEHRRRVGCGDPVYKDIINQNYPDTYRILCRNCNQCLRNYGYCSHDPE